MKKIIGVLLCMTMLFGCAACDPTPDGNRPTDNGKYVVYNQAGEVKYESENVFAAIITAGKRGKRTDRYTVKNGKTLIFQFASNKYYKFLGSTPAGTIDCTDMDKAQAEADAWAAQHTDGFVINDTGNKYVALGRIDMDNSKPITFGLEYESGSYVYMYTRRNDADYGDAYGKFEGISYIECEIDMTQMVFKYPEVQGNDAVESGWNAYIFTNFFTTSPWGCSDIGLISSTGSTLGVWAPIFNLQGKGMLNSSSPDVITNDRNAAVTTMRYEEETDTWYGTDRLIFRSFVTREYYCMQFDNLTTGRTYTYKVKCVDDALEKKADKAFGLIAASYCPVTTATDMWNARSGAVFKGLKFRNIKAARFIESATVADDYASAEKLDFSPSNPSLYGYGFAQGSDCANYEFGTDDKGSYLTVNISYTEN